jgi:hypothetical protein
MHAEAMTVSFMESFYCLKSLLLAVMYLTFLRWIIIADDFIFQKGFEQINSIIWLL